MRDCYDKYNIKIFNYLKTLKTNEELENYLSGLYYENTGEILDIKSPKNYNQKIQWLKIYDNQDIKCPLSDKFAVREWIKNKIGEEYLIKLLGVWENFDEINFNALPEKFCLKPNHASGSNFVVRDKNLLDMKEVEREARRWMKIIYGVSGYEPQYFNIKPKIIAEKYIEQTNEDLLDYKIHCFNSQPKIIQVIGGRDFKTHEAREAFFDLDWNRNDLMYHTYEQYDIKNAPQRPENLENLLEIAHKLSEGFRYVRVDLYNLDGKIKFGEMTFTPADGFGKWASDESNKIVGDLIDIN